MKPGHDAQARQSMRSVSTYTQRNLISPFSARSEQIENRRFWLHWGRYFIAMAADVADPARRARSGEQHGGKVTEHDLRLVLRLAKRAGALEVRVGGMTIMLARDAGKRFAQAAPPRRSPAVVPPRAPQSARRARTARPEEPEAEAPSTLPNSRHRRSANRLLVFQARKCREEVRGLSLTRILCRPAMQRLRESCFGDSCPNSTPPAAVDLELDVATCAEEPRQLSDSLTDAVHTPALKRRLSLCL